MLITDFVEKIELFEIFYFFKAKKLMLNKQKNYKSIPLPPPTIYL